MSGDTLSLRIDGKGRRFDILEQDTHLVVHDGNQRLRLDRIGYRGDYSFEVFNDDYQQMPLPMVSERGQRAALWLAEDVLRRSVPLPNQMRLRQARA